MDRSMGLSIGGSDKRSGGWANGRTDGRDSACLRTECKPVGG